MTEPSGAPCAPLWMKTEAVGGVSEHWVSKSGTKKGQPMDAPASLSVPAIRARRCWLHSPKTNRPCTRANGHTGRHHFAWIHLGGKVREVWG